ncbi:NAD(P)/FAD-dependent oxidoreductase [Bacillus sp. UNC438CL73TsuS30]|uniref:NAD(P)/FAD-dependent oxidoreductase n=1 Tax=Bacillus sp. UNC438CL73TsuS30 TaxID=1340434 RepID=UPI000479343C|nr:FAD-dependent oxidoreductase [Bacillus sp. UNC438CL73TsuS30]
MTKIAVIGGGIIGLACGYYLKKRHNDVVIIDKGNPGSACSAGNAGWICPTLSEPVPAPGLVSKSLKWMTKRDSPLYIKPTAIPFISNWLFQFWKNCNEETFNKGFDAALEISKNTLKLFDELESEKLIQFEIHHKGLLFAFLDKKGMEERFEELRIVNKVGLPLPIVKSKKDLQLMEPQFSDNVEAGLFLPSERHVRPESLSGGFYQWLKENGVEFRTNTEVTDIIHQNGRIEAVACGNEKIEADQFLFTSGVWANQLIKKIGYHFPMTAGKGYSITITSPNITLNHPLYLGDSKTGVTPYNNNIRIAGTMELSGLNVNIDERRVQGLRNSVSKYLKTPIKGEKEVVWTGMRPMTPDGLPILGPIPEISNSFIAAGHAMNGVSMSLATGWIMSQLINEGRTDIDINSFSLNRFLSKPVLTN